MREKLKIIAISDTHEFHHLRTLENMPEADLLIHAGDATWKGHPFAVEGLKEWFEGRTEIPNKIFVAGNHDFLFETHPKEAKEIMKDSCIYLQDSGTEIKGYKIWGSPWQPWYYDWAFQMRSETALGEIWAKIPDDTDILVTHGPPYGILDRNRQGKSIGSRSLLNRVLKLKPKVHIFGHCHEGYGSFEKDGIYFVNVAHCNRDYQAINKPVYIEVEDK